MYVAIEFHSIASSMKSGERWMGAQSITNERVENELEASERPSALLNERGHAGVASERPIVKMCAFSQCLLFSKKVAIFLPRNVAFILSNGQRRKRKINVLSLFPDLNLLFVLTEWPGGESAHDRHRRQLLP